MAAQGRHFWFFGFLCFVALCSGELCEIDCTITSDGHVEGQERLFTNET